MRAVSAWQAELAAAAVAASLAACTDARMPALTVDREPAAATDRSPQLASVTDPVAPESAGSAVRFPEVVLNDADFLESSGAMSAWQAVLERSRLLARRGQRGAVWGVFRPGPYQSWLVDAEEGEGALAIRLRLRGIERPSSGHRVVVWGAWRPGRRGTWLFDADRLALLSGEPESGQDDWHRPGLEARGSADVPAVAPVPVSQAKRGALVRFQVRGAPTRYGEGWPVSDPGEREPVARIAFPGERVIYGGQEMLSGEERWEFVPGRIYTVRVHRVERGRRGALPVWRASVPPTMVSP